MWTHQYDRDSKALYRKARFLSQQLAAPLNRVYRQVGLLQIQTIIVAECCPVYGYKDFQHTHKAKPEENLLKARSRLPLELYILGFLLVSSALDWDMHDFH